jgi:hypothetical protein
VSVVDREGIGRVAPVEPGGSRRSAGKGKGQQSGRDVGIVERQEERVARPVAQLPRILLVAEAHANPDIAPNDAQRPVERTDIAPDERILDGTQIPRGLISLSTRP